MVSMTNIYPLQPLRIHAGWRIEFNDFTEYDLALHDKSDVIELKEDILQLFFDYTDSSANIMIDLGWYPEFDANGNYRMVMIKDYDWETPLEEITTKSKSDIVSLLEKWTCYEYISKHLR